jgi:D-tagatose-1,6-bisphosphate aldolase subunit GatZ/KbaZ
MSKNVVDSIIEFDGNFGFIPSRRQVDYNGGYVNKWTTGEFTKYVNGRVPIERDHGGIGQGYKYDDGYESLKEDCKFVDIIHIDPWKNHQGYYDGLKECIKNIEFCYYTNRDMKFEVGTEESTRKFSVTELDSLLTDLYYNLSDDIFDSIEYVVVQSGVGLDLANMRNTGKFDPDRLEKMIKVCEKFGKKSKEHNGDYLSNDEYKVRFDMGLDSINIAPEFGQLETLCYLEEMGEDIDEYYDICYESKRWEKWVDKDFDPEDNKKELIKICGHYVLSDKKFLKLKPNIDTEIKQKIKNKLETFHE